jgi:hypothetical protein
MGVMVVCAGVAGFLSSAAMLAMGMDRMGLRYALAVAVAYAIFLLLLAGWVRAKCGRPVLRVDAGDVLDAAETAGDLVDSGLLPRMGRPVAEVGREIPAEAPPGSAWIEVDGLDIDHPAVWVALVVAAALGLLVSAVVVWSAPTFLAEVLLDGLVSVGLYRRVRSLQTRHWLATAVKRTWLQVLLVGVAFGVAGFLIQMHVPEASSIGAWWRHVVASR